MTSPSAAVGQEPWPLRCEATGNPCGTDTRMVGSECGCVSCQRWLASRRPLNAAAEYGEPVEWRYLFRGKGAWKHVYNADAAKALLAQNTSLPKSKQHVVEPLYSATALSALVAARDEARDQLQQVRAVYEELEASEIVNGYKNRFAASEARNAELVEALRHAIEVADEARAQVDAVKVLLYTDEVFVGTHWDGFFADPATKSWPTFCAHFSNYGADAEEISLDQIPVVADLVRKFGADAVSAWVCHRRGLTKPPKGALTPAGHEALAALQSQEPRNG